MDHNEENYDDWDDPLYGDLSEIEKIEREETLINWAFTIVTGKSLYKYKIQK